MARFVSFLLSLFMLIRFARAGEFSKYCSEEIGLNDNGSAIFSSVKLQSTIMCVRQCLDQEGCLAVVYHAGNEMCSFLNSTETLLDTNDMGYSYIFIGDHCTNGWIEFNASCYLFGNQNYTWPDAVDFCKTEGAKLVEIETASENSFIKATLMTLDHPQHWIGLNDRDLEGVWVWDSGMTVSYLGWSPGQPNNGDVSNCAAIWRSFEYNWVDEPCTDRVIYPICEQPSTSGR